MISYKILFYEIEVLIFLKPFNFGSGKKNNALVIVLVVSIVGMLIVFSAIFICWRRRKFIKLFSMYSAFFFFKFRY